MLNETTYVCLNKSQYVIWKATDLLGNKTLNIELINETSPLVLQAIQAFTPIMTNPTIPLLYKILIVVGVVSGIGVIINLAFRGVQFLVLLIAYIYTIIKEIRKRMKGGDLNG